MKHIIVNPADKRPIYIDGRTSYTTTVAMRTLAYEGSGDKSWLGVPDNLVVEALAQSHKNQPKSRK